ncbi:DUF6442 family protein [Clostridium lundense]|uniref:DUF6442 family protein n=1 Tax=Clostridium lundense TaxID=319475 RepID=UPI000488993A|nr:DUF6442 family protein [Clostridium lundense]
MNKDKLLKKSKPETLCKDERDTLLNSRASSVAGICSMILLIVHIVYNWFTGAPKDSLIGILFIYMGIYYFLNTSKEQKILRIISIFMIIAGFIFFIDPLVKRIFL